MIPGENEIKRLIWNNNMTNNDSNSFVDQMKFVSKLVVVFHNTYIIFMSSDFVDVANIKNFQIAFTQLIFVFIKI